MPKQEAESRESLPIETPADLLLTDPIAWEHIQELDTARFAHLFEDDESVRRALSVYVRQLRLAVWTTFGNLWD